MADASRIFAPLARERSDVLDAARARARRLRGRDGPPRGERDPDERLRRIVEGLRRVEGPLVFPAHPRTRASLERLGLDLPTIPPLGYLDFAALASQARVILTDSGGLQKEAYWYGVPCVTLRPITEWVDTVAEGANVLVDDDPDAIAAAAANARFPDDAPPLYGDGYAERARGGRSIPCPPVNPPETSIAVWDIAVIGAGYVGVPLAQTFADAGRRVLLVDAVPDARRRRSTAARATSRTSPPPTSRRTSTDGPDRRDARLRRRSRRRAPC